MIRYPNNVRCQNYKHKTEYKPTDNETGRSTNYSSDIPKIVDIINYFSHKLISIKKISKYIFFLQCWFFSLPYEPKRKQKKALLK